jgi:hypothetical protein
VRLAIRGELGGSTKAALHTSRCGAGVLPRGKHDGVGDGDAGGGGGVPGVSDVRNSVIDSTG